jgi:glutathione S-transferase
MSVLLYDNPASGNCYKVRLILTLLGIEFERRKLSVVDLSDRAEVLDGLSPSLNVPTVVFEDGRPLGESNAILWYFADGTRYLPADPYERAQAFLERTIPFSRSEGVGSSRVFSMAANTAGVTTKSRVFSSR